MPSDQKGTVRSPWLPMEGSGSGHNLCPCVGAEELVGVSDWVSSSISQPFGVSGHHHIQSGGDLQLRHCGNSSQNRTSIRTFFPESGHIMGAISVSPSPNERVTEESPAQIAEASGPAAQPGRGSAKTSCEPPQQRGSPKTVCDNCAQLTDHPVQLGPAIKDRKVVVISYGSMPWNISLSR